MGPEPATDRPAHRSPPTLSRRHAAGSDGARGLLFTVLGEFVLPSGASAWTSAIIDVLGRLGIEPKAARQALSRTARDGWLVAHRAGRRTRWQLTPSAEKLLTEGTERIYTFTASAATWDGRVLLVLARVPETDRPLRHLLRTRLTWAGFGSPAPGVWLSPHSDRVNEVEAILGAAGVSADSRVFLADYAGGGSLVGLMEQAWDLPGLDRAYEAFIADFALIPSTDPLVSIVDLVHSWRRFPWIDPVLPRRLLPANWSGEQAAALFAARHDAWTAAARDEWARINDDEAESTLRRPLTH